MAPKNSWSSFASRAGLGRGFSPPIFLELPAPQPTLPGSSAFPLILETLSDPCTKSHHALLLLLVFLELASADPRYLQTKHLNWESSSTNRYVQPEEGGRRRGNQENQTV